MWTRLTATEYLANSGHRVERLEISYAKLVSKLGKPHKNGDEDFPDDTDKVDVCWGFRNAGFVILIWNYKNGPAYNGEGVALENVDRFSVFYVSPESWADFKASFEIGLRPTV